MDITAGCSQDCGPWRPEAPGLTVYPAELSAPVSPLAPPLASCVAVGLLLSLSEPKVLNP